MLIFPNGPSISTFAPGGFLLTRALWEGRGGSTTWKVTPGGRESGILPSLDEHVGVVEKCEVCCWRCGRLGANAGTRKDGSVSSRLAVAVAGNARAVARILDERAQCRVDVVAAMICMMESLR